VTLRRYQAMKPSRGTVWPPDVREAAYALHRGCLGPRVGMPKPCMGEIELDHIRAGGTSLKSRSTLDNAASLCGLHHRLKTEQGRTWRPLLIDLVDRLVSGDCGHVDPVFGCSGPCQRVRA
jgi:hypothetical protein